jgi:ATP-dependent Clp endopeptidase proteolytic subunit ClpP
MITVEKTKDLSTIYLYGCIGDEIKASDFLAALKDALTNSDNINLRINSPGGDVFEGMAMYNAIKNSYANIETYIDGIAASMASIVALAGSKVYIASNAMYMIHNPSSTLSGDSATLRTNADALDKITNQAINIYAQKTGLAPEKIRELMQTTTWFDAVETVSMGFADAISDDVLDINKSVVSMKMQSTDLFKLYTLKNKNENPMKKLIQMLALSDNATETQIDEKVKSILEENKKLNQERIDMLLDKGIEEGLFPKNEKPEYVKFAMSNFDMTKKMLDKMRTSNSINKQPQPVTITSMINQSKQNPNHKFENAKTALPKSEWTLNEYRKFAPEDLKKDAELFATLLQKEAEKQK